MKRSLSFHRQSGFTLLEVLLVAMLMGLVATAVTLSMGGARGDRELDKQARRLMATLQLAQEYAVMDGRLVGIRIEDNGWQFMQRQAKDRKWLALTGDKQLGPVQLAENMTLALELEGFGWQPDSDEKTEQKRDEKERTPQLLIFPGGELSPFVLTFTQQDDDARYTRIVKGDEFGRLTLLTGDDEDEEVSE
ncbi:GspH family T2SS minor pseudopilin variant ExeH [Aeromonas veronii]|uniref:GspH family T2SS minor pseudopilin variant ExeH n=2 Tax=Aeromonas veronii TaxID=654 RepID=UPI001EEA17E6|nr:GspH family T2SS minor pseudopilin variant ExeH [Aeromonas veronii]MCF5852522.1 GspH family T2SS minor pseudopilin variant ExeH [Aeromonas veronii]